MGSSNMADTTIGEARGDLGFENHIPAIDWCVRHARFDHIDVVGESGGAPHIRNAVQIIRVIGIAITSRTQGSRFFQRGSFDLSSG